MVVLQKEQVFKTWREQAPQDVATITIMDTTDDTVSLCVEFDANRTRTVTLTRWVAEHNLNRMLDGVYRDWQAELVGTP